MKKQDDILSNLHNGDNGAPHAANATLGAAHSNDLSSNMIDEVTVNSARVTTAPWESPANNLKIPSSRTTPDTILTWPIFNGVYPPSTLQTAIFEQDNTSRYSQGDYYSPITSVLSTGFEDADIPRLTNRFLSLVHTKNPILDEHALRRMAIAVAEEGLRWNGPSCLVVSFKPIL